MSTSTRYHSLDHWRGIACLMVVASHAVPWHFVIGSWGVGIFFAISGYCITAAVQNSRNRKESLWAFMKRRAKRIYPPYWCGLAITAIAAFLLNPVIHNALPGAYGKWDAVRVVGIVTLTEAWLQPLLTGEDGRWLIGQAWSLGYEEQFYLVCGLSLFLKWRAYLPCAVALCFATVYLTHLHDNDVINISGAFLNHMWVGFAAGIFLYFGLFGTRLEKLMSLAGLGAGTIVAILYIDRTPVASLAVLFADIAIVLHQWDLRIARASGLRWLAWCGTISYSLYLTHNVVTHPVRAIVLPYGAYETPVGTVAVTIACIGLAVAIAYPFHVLFERPFMSTAQKLSLKPAAPYPQLMRRICKRILPDSIYRRYIGRHEDFSISLWRKLAVGINPGDAILDIGAYHGEYAHAAREVNAAVDIIAFEPDPHNFVALEAACRGEGIDLRQVAVSDSSGTVRFACNSQAGHISANGEGVDVNCITLDCVAARVSLAKIDVEGFEESVLRGWGAKLHEDRPTILCEVLSDDAGARVMACLPTSYRYFRIDENRGIAEKQKIYRDDWRYKNWLLIPEEKVQILADYVDSNARNS